MQPGGDGDVGDDETAASLLGWLAEQGYSRTAEVVDERENGNRLTRMLRGDCQVTVSRDRGQWYVEAGPPDRDGFDMNLWEAHLRGEQPSLEPQQFDAEARLLRNLLHEIERTLVLDAEAVESLDRFRAWVQEARWSSQAH